jgi:hypothetical protein
MTTSTPSSQTFFNVEGADTVQVKALDTGAAVLSLGAHPARLAIFFPDLQTLWAFLIEGERQAAHLATEPPVDPTVVGDGSAS